MPKTYALLDVDNTLLIDKNVFNLYLISSLKDNNIKDIYLFTDMTFSSEEIIDRKELVRILQRLGFTVHGVLTTPDLFWAIDAEELKKVEPAMQQHNINLNGEKIISPDHIAVLQQSCPTIVSSLQNHNYYPYANLGAACRNIDAPDIFQRATGAKAAADILSLLLPSRPHPKALLFKHFMANRPADCANCVIFDNKEHVLRDCLIISNDINNMGYGLEVATIQIRREDFEDINAQDRYNAQIKSFLPKQNQIQDQASMHHHLLIAVKVL